MADLNNDFDNEEKLFIFYATTSGNSAEIAMQFSEDVSKDYNKEDISIVS